MFGRKKNPPPPKKTEGGKMLMAQMGFIGDMEDLVLNSPDEEHDYEAELRALQSDDNSDEESSKSGKKGKPLSAAELNRLIHMNSTELEDVEVSDTEDPDIMAELKALTSSGDSKARLPPPSPSSPPQAPSTDLLTLLGDRAGNYESAIQKAKQAGDSSKARRYERGLTRIKEMLRDVKSGNLIDESEIPPVIAISTQQPSQPLPPLQTQPPTQPKTPPTQPKTPLTQPKTPPTQPKTPPPQPKTPPSQPKTPPSQIPRSQSGNSAEDMQQYCSKQRDLHRHLAVQLKQQGRTNEAVSCMRNGKHFEAALKSLQAGGVVDKAQLPSPLSSTALQVPSVAHHNEALQKSNVVPPMSDQEKKRLYNVPETASGGGGNGSGGGGSLLEMLQQRLQKYKDAAAEAVKEGNGGKARRMKRIVKQYEEALKASKSGASFDFTELPTPPGFPPLPTDSASFQASSSNQSAAHKPSSQQPSSITDQPSSSKQGQAPTANQRTSVGSRPSSGKPGVPRQASVVHSRAEQQAIFLHKRQLQFKKAAIDAKNSGDMELAKKYMRFSKGFDQMIEASRAGLPVDVSQIPTPPGDESDFVIVESTDIPVEGDALTVYKRLQEELASQIKLSNTNRDVFTKLGDISSANKFEKMADNSRKDLESLKNAFQHNDPVPRFHYETRHFSFVQCNHHLGDNDLEVTVVRAININLPSGYSESDLHTYVKFEFPYPNDSPQSGETCTVKGQVNPEFNWTARVEVSRKSRSFLRILKSNKTFKFEVFYKRGFFKSDKLLGTAAFKLLPLENKCTYHDSFDLMDGRKAVGGKLEVVVKIRDPFLSKQVEEKRERWLVLDEFTRSAPPRQPPQPAARLPRTAPQNKTSPSSPPSSSSSLYCISVLAYERELLEQQLTSKSPADADVLRRRSAGMQKKANELKQALHQGGVPAVKDYISNLKKLSQTYTQEAVKAGGNNHATKLALTKKALVHKEIDSLSRKL